MPAASIRGAPLRLRGGARADARRARLLVRARVAVQRAALDGLVDRALQAHVLGLGGRLVAARHGVGEGVEVGLDRGGVVAVLRALALAAEDALLLGVDVGHRKSREAPAEAARARRGAPYYSGLVHDPRRGGAGRRPGSAAGRGA